MPQRRRVQVASKSNPAPASTDFFSTPFRRTYSNIYEDMTATAAAVPK